MFITNKKIISILLVFLTTTMTACKEEKEAIYTASFYVDCPEIYNYKRNRSHKEYLDFDTYHLSLVFNHYPTFRAFPFPEQFLDSLNEYVFVGDKVTITFTESGKILSLNYERQYSHFFVKAYIVEKTLDDENDYDLDAYDFKGIDDIAEFNYKTGEVWTRSDLYDYYYYSFINNHDFKCSLNIDDPYADYQVNTDMYYAYGIIKNPEGDFYKVDDLKIGDVIYLEYQQGYVNNDVIYLDYQQGFFNNYVYGFNPMTDFSQDLLNIKNYNFTEEEVSYIITPATAF